MADTSIDFDSLLDDDDTFDAFELEALDSLPPSTSFANVPPSQRPPPAPVPRPPPQRPPPQPQHQPPQQRRPAAVILRPPQPPSRFYASQAQLPSSSSQSQSYAPQPPPRLAHQQPPPAKRPRIVGAQSGSAKQWAPPNPFHHRPQPQPPAQPLARNASLAVAPPPRVLQDEEEMPEITLGGNGGYEAKPREPGGAGARTAGDQGRDLDALRAWGASGGTGARGTGAAAAAGGAGDEALRREVEALRRERASVRPLLPFSPIPLQYSREPS